MMGYQHITLRLLFAWVKGLFLLQLIFFVEFCAYEICNRKPGRVFGNVLFIYWILKNC